MAITRVNSTKYPVENYMCASTDAQETWPLTCGAGSEMTVVNETTHEVVSFHIFDGTYWNAL